MNQGFINKIKGDKYFMHLNIMPNNNTTLLSRIYNSVFVSTDRWAYGDLYGICYLSDYKFRLEPFKKYARPGNKKETNKILYIIGDSYLADKTLNGAFDEFDDVIFLDDRFEIPPVTLNLKKENYLILEFAERNINAYTFSRPVITNTAAKIKQPNALTKAGERFSKIIFNKDITRNLELLLFDHSALGPVKNLKAEINYKLFKKLPPEVAVSTDKKRLFLNATVDTNSVQSAFKFKSDQDIALINKNLKSAKSYYTAIGFKDVILSIIPNPVSIYDDNRMGYNHLLERVEKSSSLPTISIFSLYKKNKKNLYYFSDSHWNPAGLDLWVNTTNSFFNNTYCIKKHIKYK